MDTYSDDGYKPPRRRRSLAIPLTILGVAAAGIAAIAASSGSPAKQRNIYTTRADCERDYSPSECTQGTGAQRTYFLGPTYTYGFRSTTNPGPGRYGTAVAKVETVSTRGGFGSLGKFFGSIG